MNAALPANVSNLWFITGWTMIHFLWLGAIVAAAALACRALLRRASANLRYAAALTSLIVLAALPPMTAAWLAKYYPLDAVAVRSPAPTTIDRAEDSPSLDVASAAPGSAGGSLAAPLQNNVPTPAPIPENPRQSQRLPADTVAATPTKVTDVLNAFIPYLPWVWLIGTPLTFALLVSGVVGTRRLSRASRIIENDPIVDLLAHLALSLRISRRVAIAVCDRIASPVLIGVVRPMILLPPAALTGWSPDEIEMVLLHELAHVRRWDNLVNLLQRCLESLLFFHPAVWLLSAWARSEREACCDATVVSRTNRPHAYAELLVALAAQLPRSVLFHPAATSAMAAGPLRSRIRQILKVEDDSMLITGKSLAIMLGSMIVAAALIVLYVPAIGHADTKEPAAKVTSVATALDEYRKTIVTYDLGFDSVFPQQPWTANDPNKLKRYPTADAWPSVLGHVDTDADGFRSVREKPNSSHENVSGPNAYLVPLSWSIGTKNYATLLFLEGIEKDAHVVASSYTSFACFGPMAGDAVFSSYATALVDGEMSGQITANSYFDLVVTGKTSGQITTQSYAMIYLMGGFTGQLELKHSRVYIAGNTSKADVARIKGTGQVYLEESDLRAGDQAIGGLEVVVKKSTSSGDAAPGNELANAKNVTPSAESDEPETLNFMLRRDSSGESKLLLNGKPITYDQFHDLLPKDAERLDRISTSLTADAGVPFSDVMKVVDNLEKTGFKRLTLDTRNVSKESDKFPYVVPFEKGASKFLDGDEITVDEVRGTAKTIEPGNTYQVKGKYKLHSHPSASISAHTTAREAKDGYGEDQSVQTKDITQGDGDYTLILPMSVRGWPHISFYSGGPDIGGIYFGTGDCVLKEWWGSEKPVTNQTDDVLREIAALQHQKSNLEAKLNQPIADPPGVDPIAKAIAEIDAKIKTIHEKLNESSSKVATKKDEFCYQVQFEKGVSKFLPGDDIAISEIRGTAKEFEPGNNYQIKGKYKLYSHPGAQLSAFTTAREAKDGTGPVQSIQTQRISEGDADFTIILPMTIHGWPHLSFYALDSGEGFGGVYFGTGETVLKESWAFGKLNEDEKEAERTRFQHFEKSLNTMEIVIAVFNDKLGYSHQLEHIFNQLVKEHHSVDLWGSNIDPKSADAARYQLTGEPTCIVFDHGKETARLVPIKDAEELKQFVERAVIADPSANQTSANDDWPMGVVFPSPKEGEISAAAWKQLGIKVVPSGKDAEGLPAGKLGLKVVGGVRTPPGLREPLFLVSLNDERIGDFDELAAALQKVQGAAMVVAKCQSFGDTPMQIQAVVSGSGNPNSSAAQTGEQSEPVGEVVATLPPNWQSAADGPQAVVNVIKAAWKKHPYVDLEEKDGQWHLVTAKRPSERDWPAILGESPRKDRVIADKVWLRFGLKVAPLNRAEAYYWQTERGAGGVNILGGNVPKGLPIPAVLTNVAGMSIENMDTLLQLLDANPGQPQAPVRCFARAGDNEYMFDAQPPASDGGERPGETSNEKHVPRTTVAIAAPAPTSAPAPSASPYATSPSVTASPNPTTDSPYQSPQLQQTPSTADADPYSAPVPAPAVAAARSVPTGTASKYRNAGAPLTTDIAGGTTTIAASRGISPSSSITALTESAKRLADAMQRKDKAMDQRLAAKTDKEVEIAKRDLDDANKKLEEAKHRLEGVKRQFEEEKREQEKNESQYQWKDLNRRSAQPTSTTLSAASPEEIEILSDRVKSIEAQNQFITERFKAGKGATQFEVMRAGIELNVAKSDLALAEDHREAAIDKLQDALKLAEDVLHAEQASARAGIASPDVEGIAKATQNLSAIKLKLIRLKHDGGHTNSNDAWGQRPVEPKLEQSYERKADGKSSGDVPSPAGLAAAPIKPGPDLTSSDGKVLHTVITQRTAADGRPVYESSIAPGQISAPEAPTNGESELKTRATSAKPDLLYDGKTFIQWKASWFGANQKVTRDLTTLYALEAFAAVEDTRAAANEAISYGLYADRPVPQRVREYLHTLPKTDAEPIVDGFLNVLKTDLSTTRRVQAIRGIAAIGPNAESALPELKVALAKKNEQERIAAATAIKMIVGKDQYQKPIADVLGEELQIKVEKTPDGKWGALPRDENSTADAFNDFTAKVIEEQDSLYSADYNKKLK